MKLVNNFDSEVEFDDLERAKAYYIPSKELDEEVEKLVGTVVVITQ